MSNYIKQEFDFIERTKAIIKQYDDCQISATDKFEVTLLLNCLVGLLILPQQHWFEYLPTDLISQKDWGIEENHILFIHKEELKNVKNIARHLRNSISHYNFQAFGNSNEPINEIEFKDFNREKK